MKISINMSAHVLLDLLNELGERIRCEAMPSILSVFPNDNMGARMLDSINHMTLKIHLIRVKTSRFRQ